MNKDRKRLFNKVIICFLLAIFILTIGSIIYFKYSIDKVITDEENSTVYDKHIAMIADDPEDTFWKAVYKSAKQAGDEQGYYVEMYGENLPIEYSKQELIRIAVDASVDGIVVEGDDSEQLMQEIARAEERKIPVVTVLSDSTQSARQCYVGVNSYNLGQTIGKQVLQNIDDNVKTVCILMNRNEADTSQNIVYSGISDVLGENKGTQYKIYATAIQDGGTFGAEETVRDIFLNEEQLPDVLICLDKISTTSACQAAVDFNKVGEVKIIGCYSSDTILEAIKKDVLQATVAFDTQNMGIKCIEAMTEYWENGHVSGYKPVEVRVITLGNVEEYMENETDIQ